MRIGDMGFWPSAVAGGCFYFERKEGGRKGGRIPQSRLRCAPLGKGDGEDGGTDCHTSDIGHWFAMTHYKKCGAIPAGDREGRPYGGVGAPRPAEGIGVGIFGSKNLM